MILIAGSTNELGCEFCYALASKGISIRALVLENSDPAWAERLQDYGATLARGNPHDPAFLADCFIGINGVICAANWRAAGPPGENQLQDFDQADIIALVEAAKEVDIRRFVYISQFDTPGLDLPIEKGEQAIEQALLASGIPYTILHTSACQAAFSSTAAQPAPPMLQRPVQNLAQLAMHALRNPGQRSPTHEPTRL